jgi:hypothetical protein
MEKKPNQKRRSSIKAKQQKVVLPFGKSFEEAWELWKRYKREEHRFSYKSAISEQSALNKLVELSNGDEETAKAIIKQSFENGWKGLFALQKARLTIERGGKADRESIHSAITQYYSQRSTKK